MKILANGIDVSSYQGQIDWDAVKASGVAFAILRCGWGDDISTQDDPLFQRNADECERVGLPYGVYLYSYADSVEHAKSEAAHVLRQLGGRRPLYPVYLDLEDAGTTGTLSNEGILEVAKTFVSLVEEQGYWVGIYSNRNWAVTRLTDPWYNTKARWIAQYNSTNTYPGSYGLWQYSNAGSVSGIRGRVLLDRAYVDYPTEMRAFYARQGIETAPTDPAPPPVEQTYVVKAGDTLSEIGARFGVPWKTLASYNGIENPSLIYPGQIIRIPKGDEQTYVVKAGDTLSEIGACFGVPWKTLASYNGIENPSLIYPGQIIRIP
ncbi:MAG: LysM peptidoglycan-binding domain-containing protein [Clostridia bacterium]|nr:LysM peptidoglycan-binding domain-containing protein [Clostridia bacterium]